jgi:hypothetical protein
MKALLDSGTTLSISQPILGNQIYQEAGVETNSTSAYVPCDFANDRGCLSTSAGLAVPL